MSVNNTPVPDLQQVKTQLNDIFGQGVVEWMDVQQQDLYGRGGELPTLEHFFFDFSEPDLIKNRPSLYEEYVNVLADVLLEKYEQALIANKAQVWNKTHELAMYAVTKKISLIGIINYEVAKLRNLKTFIVHINISYQPGQEKSHDEYVANTRMYLTDKRIRFSTHLTNDGTVFELLD